MDKLCDLHTHSTYSDGTYSPAELICEAERAGLSAIALTDHNTVAGLPNFLAAAENSSVTAIPGIEISSDYQELELHIVTLFLRPEHYEPIRELTDAMNLRKQQSNLDLIAKLPLIKQLNKVLGLAVGVVSGVLWVLFVTCALQLLARVGWVPALTEAVIAKTWLVSWVAEMLPSIGFVSPVVITR